MGHPDEDKQRSGYNSKKTNIDRSQETYGASPTENDLLQDYLKCVDALSVNDEKTLQKKVDDLANKSRDNDDIMRGKLQEKDEEMKSMKQQLDTMQSQIQGLIT
jgi:hypothetical protein